MGWNKLPPEILIIIVKHLAVLSDFYYQWIFSTRYREYEYFAHSITLPQSWWKEYGNIFLVSRSFSAIFRNAILEANSPDLILKCTNDESLALEAIRRAVRNRDISADPLLNEEPTKAQYLYEMLCVAASREFGSCMELLLELGADPDKIDRSSLLNSCTFFNRPKAVELLIRYGVDLEVQSDPGRCCEYNTPLADAVYHGHHEIVDMLLKSGANRNVVIDWYHGPTAVLYFGKNWSKDRVRMVEIFKANGVDIDTIEDIVRDSDEE